MNAPNLVSIFRLFLTLFFILAVNDGKLRLALYLFVLQGLSDLLDGFLARTMGKKTNLGAFLDPVADKTMLVSAYVVLYVQNAIPLWMTSIVLARDVILCCGFFVLYGLSYKVKLLPSIWGKITTAFQIITVVYVLWSESRELGPLLFYVTSIFTIVSGLQYVARGIRILSGQRTVAE
jgi:cardiolipin synthase (CMP-forming)